MTNEYELAGPTRAGLIYEKQDLLGPMLPGMLDAPHPMVAGTTEKDYYNGAGHRGDRRAAVLGGGAARRLDGAPDADATGRTTGNADEKAAAEGSAAR